MAKIVSIRPGGTLEGRFAEYLLPELLMDILRGNLTGELSLRIGTTGRNRIYFRDGVPVFVQVPEAGISLALLLAETGQLTKEQADEIRRQSAALGRSEADLIVSGGLLTNGALVDARRKKAREELVRVFELTTSGFVFREGERPPPDAPLVVLDPLPILFEGVLKSPDRRLVDRFLESQGDARFRLTATYPRGLDPFEWGAEVESAILRLEDQASLQDLVTAGLGRSLAAVALTTLDLAGMLELARPKSVRARPLSSIPEAAVTEGRERVPRPTREPVTPDGDDQGLVVHRRSDRPPPRSAAPAEGPLQRAPGKVEIDGPGFEAALAQIGEHLNALRGRSYFKILKVADGAAPEQVERSYRYLIRQLDEGGEDAGRRALRDCYREAYEVLQDPVQSRRYRELVELAKTSTIALAERQAFEVSGKLSRAVRAMCEGRVAEAAYLLDWASALDLDRKDLRVYRGVLKLFRSPLGQRRIEAATLKAQVAPELLRAPVDSVARLAMALAQFEEGDLKAAEQTLSQAERPDHPLAQYVRLRMAGGQ